MSIEYYAFALFIAALICIIAIIFKMLFADVKRQKKMLDERETQILHLYNTIETIMEEFSDQVKASVDEIKAGEQRVSEKIISLETPKLQEVINTDAIIEKSQLPRSEPLATNRIRAAGEVIERAERVIRHDYIVNEDVIAANVSQSHANNGMVFQKFFEDSSDAQAISNDESLKPPSKNDRIRALAQAGKSDVEIASQLGITRSEVQIIASLAR